MKLGPFDIIVRRRNLFHPRQMLSVGPGVLVPAHIVGLPANMEKYAHIFSNRELNNLADIARRHAMRGSAQFWVETLVSAQGDGTSISNNSSANSIIPAAAKITLRNNYFDYVGKVLRVTACFRVSNIATTPGTLTLDFRLGGTVVLNGGAQQLSTTTHATLPVWLQFLLTCRAIGATGNFMGQGMVMGQPISFTNSADLGTSNSIGSSLLPNTAPAVGNNVDTTTGLSVDLQETFSIANAGNLIQLHQYMVESLN